MRAAERRTPHPSVSLLLRQRSESSVAAARVIHVVEAEEHVAAGVHEDRRVTRLRLDPGYVGWRHVRWRVALGVVESVRHCWISGSAGHDRRFEALGKLRVVIRIYRARRPSRRRQVKEQLGDPDIHQQRAAELVAAGERRETVASRGGVPVAGNASRMLKKDRFSVD